MILAMRCPELLRYMSDQFIFKQGTCNRIWIEEKLHTTKLDLQVPKLIIDGHLINGAYSERNHIGAV
jgi:hypothetical protein